MGEGVYSDGLQREMVWLSGQLPYAQVSEAFKRIGGYELASTSIWAVCERQGERLLTAVEQQQSQVGVERVRWEQNQYAPDARKGVSMDGGMVRVRGEGWKELKVGVVSNLVAPEDREWADPDAQLSYEQHYTATLSSADAFSVAKCYRETKSIPIKIEAHRQVLYEQDRCVDCANHHQHLFFLSLPLYKVMQSATVTVCLRFYWFQLTSSIRSSKRTVTVSPSSFPIALRTSAFMGSLCVPSPIAINELRNG